MSVQLTIARLGAQGDGVVETERGPVFVPFALPGEEVAATIDRPRRAVWACKTSLLRVELACCHFGTCAAAPSSISPPPPSRWKRDIVVSALRPAISMRRRRPCNALPYAAACDVTARRTERGALVGYNKALPSEIVAVEERLILLPEMVAALRPAARIAALICATPRPSASSSLRRRQARYYISRERRTSEEARAAAHFDGPVSRGYRWTTRSSSSQ